VVRLVQAALPAVVATAAQTHTAAVTKTNMNYLLHSANKKKPVQFERAFFWIFLLY
jgi:hypothetical protein